MKKLVFFLIFFIPFLIYEEASPKKNLIADQEYQKLKDEEFIERMKSFPFEGFADDIIQQFQPDSGYYNIALGFAQVGKFKSALKYAKKIEDNNEKDDCLSFIAFEMYSDGLEDKALATIDKIVQEFFAQQAFKMIIDDMINNKNYVKALPYGLSYQDEYNLINTKKNMITTMLKNNETDKAKEFFLFIKAENVMIDLIYLEIVKFYIKQNNINGLYDFLNETYTKITDERKEIIVSQAGRLNRSYLILDQLESLNNVAKDREYANIACKYVKEYKHSEAYQLLKKIENHDNRDRVYSEFVRHSINDKKMDKAVSFIDSIYSLENKDNSYRICSKSYIDLGDFEKAIELSKRINNLNKREDTMVHIAIHLFQTVDTLRFDVQVEAIKTVKSRDRVYLEIIKLLLKRNNYDNLELYTRQLGKERTKNHAFSLIAMEYININDLEKARYFIYRITDDDVRKYLFLLINDK